MLFEFHNSFTFFLPAIPFPIHPAKQTVHFSPESLKPSIHTVCLEKQNRYLVDPKSFHRKLFDPADGLISHMEDHFIVLEQVDRLALGELKELTSLLQNREGGLLAAVINEASQEASVQNAAAGFFPAQIRLPALSEWPLSDRLNLIRRSAARATLPSRSAGMCWPSASSPASPLWECCFSFDRLLVDVIQCISFCARIPIS